MKKLDGYLFESSRFMYAAITLSIALGAYWISLCLVWLAFGGSPIEVVILGSTSSIILVIYQFSWSYSFHTPKSELDEKHEKRMKEIRERY